MMFKIFKKLFIDTFTLNFEVTAPSYGAVGDYSFAEGGNTVAYGAYSHAEGKGTLASGKYSHAEGSNTQATNEGSHAEGIDNLAYGWSSHVEGVSNKASGGTSHAEGSNTKSDGESAHAEGSYTLASGNASHAEGYKTIASGLYSHAEGKMNQALGDYSHAQNGNDGDSANPTKAGGMASHTEGAGTRTGNFDSGDYPYSSDKYNFDGSGKWAHAEGNNTIATGDASHSEGISTKASGDASHAGGISTRASGDASHAGGRYTIAGYNNQTVIGSYNYNRPNTIFEIGGGSGDYDKRNLLEVYTGGEILAPNLPTTSITDPKCLVTKEYVDASGGGELVKDGLGYRIKNLSIDTLGTNAINLSEGGHVTGVSTLLSGVLTSTNSKNVLGFDRKFLTTKLIERNSKMSGGNEDWTLYVPADISNGDYCYSVVSSYPDNANYGYVRIFPPTDDRFGVWDNGYAELSLGRAILDLSLSPYRLTISSDAILTFSDEITSVDSWEIIIDDQAFYGEENMQGDYSIVGGYNTSSGGKYSIACGYYNIVANDYQAVIGKYNLPTLGNLFEIGNGTDGSHRSNALEVHSEGYVLVPSLKPSAITDPKCLVTKEYLFSVEFGNALPIYDPIIKGKLWNDSGVLKISAG